MEVKVKRRVVMRMVIYGWSLAAANMSRRPKSSLIRLTEATSTIAFVGYGKNDVLSVASRSAADRKRHSPPNAYLWALDMIARYVWRECCVAQRQLDMVQLPMMSAGSKARRQIYVHRMIPRLKPQRLSAACSRSEHATKYLH